MRINLDRIKMLAARLKTKPADVVGLDIARSGVKAVRAKRGTDGTIALIAADILPAILLPGKPGEAPVTAAPFSLPKNFACRYASLAVTGENAVVKLLNFPGRSDSIADQLDEKVVEGLAVENAENYRINYKLLLESHGKAESRALAVAVPDVEAAGAVMLLPSGIPVPRSVELSGLAAMTAFMHGPGETHADDTVGFLEFGAAVSFFAIFHKKTPVLIRKFDVGSVKVLEKVRSSLGIDMATAEGILADGSFDISQQMGDVMSGFVKQIMVSRDFVERRENCRIGKVYASGGMTRSRDWLAEIKSAFSYEVSLWNPLDTMKVERDAFPERLKGHESRFAAAVGACLATLAEETT